MSNEIATYSMILSKLSLGKSGTECPTKTQILAINSLIVINNASTYGANECVKIDDIRKADSISSYGEWVITVSANPTSVPNSGGTSTITASAKRTVHWASGKVTEETGNPTLSTNLSSLSSSSSPSTLTLGENTSTSSRTATIKATHGGKSATCTVTQAGAEPTIEYVFSINPWQVEVGSSGGSGSIAITSYKLVNHNQIKVGYNIDRSFLPSWATYNPSDDSFTISANTTTSERRANVYFEQEESGKRDYAIIIQAAYVPPADNYVFVWAGNNSTADQTLNLPYTRTVGSYTVTSTKNGSNQSWSVSSSPSWISTTTSSNNLSYTASENTGSARSGKVVLTQSGSGKTLTISVSQAAYVAQVEWRYKFGFNNGVRDNISIAIRTMEEYDGASVTFASYKSKYVDGVEDVSSRQYVDFSIGDYASWATVTKVSSSIANEGKFKFTLSSNFNNRSNRQTFVTVTQNESKKSIICDIMQVGSDAFVATYYQHVIGSDTYPDEISFGIVITPTTKQYEWESTFEVHTVDSDYDAWTYNYGNIREVKKVTARASMETTWFGYEYIQNGGDYGGSYQYDLLKVNAPKSDGANHSEKLYIAQLVTSAPSTKYNYREITNTPILAVILVTQKGNIIS